MSGLKSVLVKLDGSAYSHVATEVAIRWAQQYGCELLGISVVNERGILSSQPEESTSETERRDDQVREARAVADLYLETFADHCREAGVTVTTCRKMGKSADRILLEVQRHDLVILGRETHFHSSMSPSASIVQVLRHSPRPIVTVPLVLPTATAALIAYDATPTAARALAAFVHLGLASDRDVHVVCVRDSAQQAEDDVAWAIDYLTAHGIAAVAHCVDSRSAADRVIMPMIGELDAGLLVAGAYGRSKTKEFLFGSTTRKLIQGSPVPIFLFH